jgi:hypothetical protein
MRHSPYTLGPPSPHPPQTLSTLQRQRHETETETKTETNTERESLRGERKWLLKKMVLRKVL